MHLQKKHGAASIGEFEWTNDGDIIEVPDVLGQELLAIAPDEFTHVIKDATSAKSKPSASRIVKE